MHPFSPRLTEGENLKTTLFPSDASFSKLKGGKTGKTKNIALIKEKVLM